MRLLKNGANPNVFDSHGETPLTNVAYYWPFIEGFQRDSEDVEQETIDSSVLEKQTTITKLLVKYGADVNLCFFQECNALFDACVFRNVELVKLLLQLGADVNINCYPEDEPWVISTAYHSVLHHLSDDRGTIYEAANAELDKLLSDHGALHSRYQLSSSILEA